MPSGNLFHRKYITLTYFFQFYPDKTWKNWVTIDMNNGKKMKDIRNGEKNNTYFFTKDYGYKCIGLITTIAKHDIQNKKLITFDCLR